MALRAALSEELESQILRGGSARMEKIGPAATTLERYFRGLSGMSMRMLARIKRMLYERQMLRRIVRILRKAGGRRHKFVWQGVVLWEEEEARIIGEHKESSGLVSRRASRCSISRHSSIKWSPPPRRQSRRPTLSQTHNTRPAAGSPPSPTVSDSDDEGFACQRVSSTCSLSQPLSRTHSTTGTQALVSWEPPTSARETKRSVLDGVFTERWAEHVKRWRRHKDGAKPAFTFLRHSDLPRFLFTNWNELHDRNTNRQKQKDETDAVLESSIRFRQLVAMQGELSRDAEAAVIGETFGLGQRKMSRKKSTGSVSFQQALAMEQTESDQGVKVLHWQLCQKADELNNRRTGSYMARSDRKASLHMGHGGQGGRASPPPGTTKKLEPSAPSSARQSVSPAPRRHVSPIPQPPPTSCPHAQARNQANHIESGAAHFPRHCRPQSATAPSSCHPTLPVLPLPRTSLANAMRTLEEMALDD